MLYVHFPFTSGTASLPPYSNGLYTLYDMKGWDVVFDSPWKDGELDQADPDYQDVRSRVPDSSKFDFYALFLNIAGKYSKILIRVLTARES